MKNLITLFFFFCVSTTFAQRKYPAIVDTLPSVKIDSALVITAKAGLSEDDFINEILNDTLFYKAFKLMKKYSFIADNTVITYDKNNKRLSRMYRRIYHNNTGPEYKAEPLITTDSGKVYDRKGEYDLYTVQMFSYIFMNPHNTDFTEEKASKGEKSDESYKSKLKTLVFSPGKAVTGVPLVSNKTAIFDPKMRKYYDYKFYHATYHDTIPVYRFKCSMKPELRKGKQDDVMIKELTTIFDKKNFNILGRYIEMSYGSVPFDFDVKMNIELSKIGDELLPVKITYDGYWDIPFKEPERCSFSVKHSKYKR